MAKSKKTYKAPVEEYPKPYPCGTVYDVNGTKVGRYVYFSQGDEDKLDRLCQSLLDTYEKDNNFFITVDLETQGLDYINLEILLFSLSWDGHHAAVWSPHKCADKNGLWKKVLETIPINNQNIKFDMKWKLAKYGVLPTIKWCTLVSTQLGWAGAFPGNQFSLDNLVANLMPELEISKEEQTSFIGMPTTAEFRNEQVAYAACDSMTTHRLKMRIENRLLNQGKLIDVWNNIELPLLQCLVKPEVRGIKVDVERLHEAFDEAKQGLHVLEEKMQQLIDELPEDKKEGLSFYKKKQPFNSNSWQQILEVLAVFGIRITNTSEDTLVGALGRTQNPMLQLIIEHKHLYNKTYKFLKGWIEEHVNPTTGCIHPNYKTNHAETGRLASSDPNVQNIPKKLRELIIARENKVLITNDYSQFEFRAAAAYTGEQYLIDAFNERAELLPAVREVAKKYGFNDADGFVKAVDKKKVDPTQGERELARKFALTDIHRRNAALVLGKDVAEISPVEREVGKTLGYALMYGAGPSKMYEQLIKAEFFDATPAKCKIYQEEFMAQLPKVAEFIKEIHRAVIYPGFLETFVGRRRFFKLPPRYASNYRKVYEDCCREGVNFIMQGSNADATKMGIVRVSAAYESMFPEDKQPMILLNVHDEIVTEADEDVAEQAAAIAEKIMIEAGLESVAYRVPIEVSCSIGAVWSK